jgi:hypothetical protein
VQRLLRRSSLRHRRGDRAEEVASDEEEEVEE